MINKTFYEYSMLLYKTVIIFADQYLTMKPNYQLILLTFSNICCVLCKTLPLIPCSKMFSLAMFLASMFFRFIMQ